MINPEGRSPSEEELGIKKPEIASESKDSPVEYVRELRDIIKEASGNISDLERQRKMKAEIIAGENDVSELKKMIIEYNQLEYEIAQAREKLNDATVAMETSVELGINLPQSEEELPEYDIDVSDLDNRREEVLDALADVNDMNSLLIQREKIKHQLKQAGAAKDEDNFNELTDSYVLLSKEIEALAKKETAEAKKVSELTEIKKMAA